MTKKQIEDSISTRRLKLSLWSWIDHFGLPLFFLIGTLLTMFLILGKIIDFQIGKLEISWTVLFATLSVLLILTVTFSLFQYKRLQLEIIKFEDPYIKLFFPLTELCKRNKWILKEHNQEHLIINTPANLISWGEQITVLFSNDKILVNCIASAGMRSTMFTFGRRKAHIDIIKEYLKSL